MTAGAARGFAVLAGGNLLGKVAAIAREVVFAATFGTGSVASGFRVAQTSSIVTANVVSGDVFAAFAPSYSRAAVEGADRARRLLIAYAFWLGLLLLLLAGAVFVARDVIVGFVAPGASAGVKSYAADFLGVLAWAIPLYGVTAVFAYALGVHERYVSTSVRPIIQSTGLIAGTMLALWTHEILWLGYGFVAAWVFYTVITLSTVSRHGLLAGASWADFRGSGGAIGAGFRAVIPLLPLPLAVQMSIVLERVFSVIRSSWAARRRR